PLILLRGGKRSARMEDRAPGTGEANGTKAVEDLNLLRYGPEKLAAGESKEESS
ncbi:hypothetical protein Tco_0667558, partial [Tanacetum coccineum]